MRFFAPILFLFLSVSVLAQGHSNSIADTSSKGLVIKDTYMPSNVPPPLIILNGEKYKGEWKSINPDSIAKVEVLKDKAAVSIYGHKGANGVIIITTKNYVKTNTINVSHEDNNLVYVIDGMPVTKDQVDTAHVLIKESISRKKLEESGFYPENRMDTLIVMVTKQTAIKSYQEKFSAFSKKYKDYLERNNRDDHNLLYVVNGISIQGKPNDIIKALYKVPADKIKAVDFNPEEIDIENGTVTINVNE